MPSFADVLDAQSTDAIRAFVISEATKARETQLEKQQTTQG